MSRIFGKKKDKEKDKALEERVLEAEIKLRIERENAQKRDEQRQKEIEAERNRADKFKYLQEAAERAKATADEEKRVKEEWEKEQNRMSRAVKENERATRLRQRTPEAVRHLRQLVRKRYELDCNIWIARNVQDADRDQVRQDMAKSDAVLSEILTILETWDESGWGGEEWERASSIKEKLNEPIKRLWGDDGPWQEGELV